MTTNSLAFVALCNEYCSVLENALSYKLKAFLSEMLRLLPRIYISAFDLQESGPSEGYSIQALEEEQYNVIRKNISVLLGSNDTYLEAFEEDMKYSDTPIGASVSESLADLFQVFYNMLETIRDAPEDVAEETLADVKDSFMEFWSQTLCNVMRPLNNIFYNSIDLDE